MRFSCGKTWEATRAHLEQWHSFFVIWPRTIGIRNGTRMCVWMETVERRGVYCEGNWAGGDGWQWEFRIQAKC
jgi:hypothetical protein